MTNLYEFKEHNLMIRGEKDDLLNFAIAIREAAMEGTLSDLAYQIEYEFDVDSIRTINEDIMRRYKNV